MNATQGYGAHPHHHPYMDSHQPHLGHGHAQSSAPPYTPYHHQAPLLPPSMGSYSTPAPGYHYSYGTPVSAAGHHAPAHYSHHPMPLQTLATNPATPGAPPTAYPPHAPDTTGGVAPPGHKPRLTGTVWEDEGTVCFQVEVRGICVARRQDNCFINGTKLLNVANMTRGRRDGILKSEKTRKVVKIGPMHLKGVWIPFERALEFANKEKITEQLYPLFVNNISPMLGGSMNSVASSTRRHDAQSGGQPPNDRTPQSAHAESPALQQQQPQPTHNGVVGAHESDAAAQQTPTSRPDLGRAQTFPTPPASATSAVGTHGQAPGSYNGWDGTTSSSHPLPLDNINSTKSMPTTPTNTTPDQHIPSMHYPPATTSYDTSRSVYSAPTQTSSYAPAQNHLASSYGLDSQSRKAKDEEVDHTRDYSNHGYSTSYSYGDQTHVSPDMKPSPSHNATNSGRATPRTMANQQQSHWPSGYSAPQRQYSSGNLAYVVPGEGHPTNGYAAPSAYANGTTTTSNKRGRDYEEDDYGSNDAMKKRKMTHDGFSAPRPTAAQRQ